MFIRCHDHDSQFNLVCFNINKIISNDKSTHGLVVQKDISDGKCSEINSGSPALEVDMAFTPKNGVKNCLVLHSRSSLPCIPFREVHHKWGGLSGSISGLTNNDIDVDDTVKGLTCSVPDDIEPDNRGLVGENTTRVNVSKSLKCIISMKPRKIPTLT